MNDILDDWINGLSWFSSPALDRVLDHLHKAELVVPALDDLLNAYMYVRPQDVRVVIVGTHPYANPAHAHGVAFSVPPTVTDYPHALRDIYTELQLDCGITPDTGYLGGWARQGVLLLNNSMSYATPEIDADWSTLVDETIRYVSSTTRNTVFLFWGNAVCTKRLHVNRQHCVVATSAPGSTDVGFFGSRSFSKANEYLTKYGRGSIDWSCSL